MKNKSPYTFVSILEGEKPQPCKTFKEAWIKMFNWVSKQLADGQLTYQVLETAIWIEAESGIPIFFYNARDLAIDMGIFKDGKLVT